MQMPLFLAFIVIKDCGNFDTPIGRVAIYWERLGQKMPNMHNQSEHNAINSQDYELVETLKRKAAQLAKIPPRASAHPSALASVQPRYTRHLNDHQLITPFDGVTIDSIELAPSTQRSTDDLDADNLFENIAHLASIDELDTFPQGTRSHSQIAAERNTVAQIDTLLTPAVQNQSGSNHAPLSTRPLGELPRNLGQLAQSPGFSLERWVDDIRWWLVFPGRLEFLLWLVGAIILVCLTSFFLMVVMAVWMR